MELNLVRDSEQNPGKRSAAVNLKKAEVLEMAFTSGFAGKVCSKTSQVCAPSCEVWGKRDPGCCR